MNRLSECTPGPYVWDGTTVRDGIKGKAIAKCSPNHCVVDWTTAEANALLFAESYDHALLLAAFCAGIARHNGKCVVLYFGTNHSQNSELGKSGDFAAPALTPELRAALERALGITREGGKA